MKIRPKSKERIKAEVSTLASERVRSDIDRAYMLENAGRLAVDGMVDAEWMHPVQEFLNGKIITRPEKRTAATVDTYQRFLKTRTRAERDQINGRTKLYEAFEPFAPVVKEILLSTSRNGKKPHEHPSYFSEGTYSNVFAIEHEGQKYMVRIPFRETTEEINDHTINGVLGEGIPHLEQIVAVSPESGATVSEILPGTPMRDMTTEKLSHVTDEQLEELLDTLKTADERGIGIDAGDGNIMYGPRSGFGIIDYYPQYVRGNPERGQSVGFMVAMVSFTLSRPHDYAIYPGNNETVENYKKLLEFEEVQLDVLERFREIASRKLSGQDLENALVGVRDFDGMNKYIEQLKSNIEMHSDPEEVEWLVTLGRS